MQTWDESFQGVKLSQVPYCVPANISGKITGPGSQENKAEVKVAGRRDQGEAQRWEY